MRNAFQLLFSILITSTAADFGPNFRQFLINNYGQGIADQLGRRDLGDAGAFGGNTHTPGTRTSRQAVILVHGITNTAGTFHNHRMHALKVGWNINEVYATTYGDGGKTPAPMVDIKCDYIKQVRYLIQAVAAFTLRKVDIIGYSMGSPVARKAILGGYCVDTGEPLGPPLTALIDTFVSVAGANQGSFLCLFPLPGACNMVNGLSCQSRLMSDINAAQRYEGSFIYSIFSPQDDKVGYQTACGTLASRINGANGEFVKSGNHDNVIGSTAQLTFNLIHEHNPLGQ